MKYTRTHNKNRRKKKNTEMYALMALLPWLKHHKHYDNVIIISLQNFQ